MELYSIKHDAYVRIEMVVTEMDCARGAGFHLYVKNKHADAKFFNL